MTDKNMKIETKRVEALLLNSQNDLDVNDFILSLDEEDIEEIEEYSDVMEKYGNQIIYYTIERLKIRLAFMVVGQSKEEQDNDR